MTLATSTLARTTAPAPLADVLAAAGPAIPDLMETVEARLTAATQGYGPLLGAHAAATIAAGGKRLRPLLVLLAADAGELDAAGRGRAVRAAVAVELLHAATLVHDDVIDGAGLRRGHPTVVATAGRRMATATGDLLFAQAFVELVGSARPDEVRVLSAASTALAEGELLQRADAGDADLTVERYLERCELKTARLFQAACELGALAADGARDPLREFGRGIGLAFQVLDDVLDVSGPAARTGKHRGTDLLDGTVTLPLILARREDPALGAALATVRSPDGAERLCERIEASGALEEARGRALAIVAGAKAHLSELPDGQRAALELVADATVARYA